MNKIEKTEQMLIEYRINEIDIDNIELEIAELKEVGVSGFKISEVTSKTNRISNPVEEQFILSQSKIEELTRLKNRLERQNKKIDNAITILKDKERKIIEYRYFQYRDRSIGFIAKQLDLSEAWTRELKRQALEKIAERIFICA